MVAAAGPYVGLQPFTEGQRAYFFGRQREVRLVGANAFASKLTVLYGESGVGKSSLLMAGVVPDLRRKPRTAVVLFREWQRADAVASLKAAIAQAADSAAGRALALDTTLPLDELLGAAGRAIGGTTIVLLDQFEEYFLYFPSGPAAEGFDAELARSVNRRDVNAGFVLSIREDSLSRLDRLRARIPTVLANPLRIRHLREQDAREVIVRPLEVWNAQPGVAAVAIEPELVDAVLAQTRSGRVSLTRAPVPADGAAAASADADADEPIEAPYLQLVLTRLWDTERAAGSTTLRRATLDSLGGAATIVRTHLDQVMDRLAEPDQALCAAFFDRLVTPSGGKIACRLDDLRQWAGPGARADDVDRVVAALAGPQARILRAIDPLPGEPPQYEIFHDVLAAGVLDWRARFVEAQRLQAARAQAQQEARRRSARTRQLGLLGLGALVLAGALWAWFKSQRDLREAQASELAGRAIQLAREDPVASLRLAVLAADKSEQRAATALRFALASLHPRARLELPEGRRIVAAGVADDGASVALGFADGTIELRDIPSLELRWSQRVPGTPPTVLRYRAGPRQVLLLGGGIRRVRLDTGQVETVVARGAFILANGLDINGRAALIADERDAHSLVDTAEGSVTPRRDCGGRSVLAIGVGDDGVRVAELAGKGATHTIRICEPTARIIAELPLNQLAEGETPHRGSFSPDATLLAVGEMIAEQVHVWEIASGSSTTLRDFTATPMEIRFGPHRTLAVTASDGTVELWKLSGLGKASGGTGPPRNELVARFPPAPGTFLGVPAGPGGEFVLGVEAGGLTVLPGLNGATAGSTLPGAVGHATWAADGTLRAALTSGAVGTVHADGRFEPIAAARDGALVVRLRASPDGRRVAIGWDDGLIALWDLAGGRRLAEFRLGAPLAGLSWASRCCAVVARGADGTARLYELREGGRVDEKPLPPQRDEGWLAPSRRFWLTDRAQVVGPLGGASAPASRAYGGKVLALRWPFIDDHRAVVGNELTQAIESLSGDAAPVKLVGHSAAVYAADISPDGRLIATASADWNALLWDTASGRRQVRLTGHTRDVRQVAFSDDGVFVATAADDRTLRLWDTGTGTQLLRVELPTAKVRLLDFRAGRVALATDEGRLLRVDCEPCLPPARLKALAAERLARLDAATAVRNGASAAAR